MSRRRSGVQTIVAVLLAAGLAVTLGACGANRASVATQVGTTPYSMSYLAQMTQDYLKETGQTGMTGSDLAKVQSTLVTEFIVNQLTSQAASDLGVSVPEERVNALRSQLQNDGQYQEVLRTAVIPLARLDDMIRWTLSRTAVGDKLANVSASQSGNQESVNAATAYVARLSAREGVSVNPVFGRWDGTQLKTGEGALVPLPVATASSTQ